MVRIYVPKRAPEFLLDREEWPTFDCGFQCPATGYGLGIRWNDHGDEKTIVDYDRDIYGEPDPLTIEWASYYEGAYFSTAAALVDQLLDGGCDLNDLL